MKNKILVNSHSSSCIVRVSTWKANAFAIRYRGSSKISIEIGLRITFNKNKQKQREVMQRHFQDNP